MSQQTKNVIWILAILLLAGGYLIYRVYTPQSSTSDLPEPLVRIEAAEAGNHVGSVAEVCGEVASADYLPQVEGAPTFLNLGSAYPDQDFTAVIWGEDRGLWEVPPEQQYENREICVTGTIDMHEGTPQIIATRPEQINRIPG